MLAVILTHMNTLKPNIPGAALLLAMRLLRLAQRGSLGVGMPLLCFLGMRLNKQRPNTFGRHLGLAFLLLAAILGLLAASIYEDFGLIWPGAMAAGFMLIFGSALCKTRCTKAK